MNNRLRALGMPILGNTPRSAYDAFTTRYDSSPELQELVDTISGQGIWVKTDASEGPPDNVEQPQGGGKMHSSAMAATKRAFS
jgi:hypothetical protein